MEIFQKVDKLPMDQFEDLWYINSFLVTIVRCRRFKNAQFRGTAISKLYYLIIKKTLGVPSLALFTLQKKLPRVSPGSTWVG